ncbi:hypothetical protein C8R44DRAFT_754438 [Mycena epipterygia]|nr:hypothetical protein C8R44DRAFT_754438 [Mycena epipterygia]
MSRRISSAAPGDRLRFKQRKIDIFAVQITRLVEFNGGRWRCKPYEVWAICKTRKEGDKNESNLALGAELRVGTGESFPDIELDQNPRRDDGEDAEDHRGERTNDATWAPKEWQLAIGRTRRTLVVAGQERVASAWPAYDMHNKYKPAKEEDKKVNACCAGSWWIVLAGCEAGSVVELGKGWMYAPKFADMILRASARSE